MYKKLGIVTFHHASSYGAVLQTYALQNFLRDAGIPNKVVNYRCKFIEDRAKVFKYIKGKAFRLYIYYFVFGREIANERRNSQWFGKNFLDMTEPYYKNNIGDCVKDFDGFIAGSDQVWSPICVGFDSTYFLDFAKDGQKYSYSASFGTKVLPEEKIPEYKRRLQAFNGISVREASGKELVEGMVDKKAHIHIDPTLLLPKEKWDRLASTVEIDQPYIFLFTVQNPIKLVDYALKLSERTGLKVIYLNKVHKYKHPNLKYMNAVTADKFVGLIKNAAYVCTNSFHGNAFSLIYHKNFVVETVTNLGENNRSRELMIKAGLKNRILDPDHTSPDIDYNTNWSRVDSFLEEEQEKSRAYLLSIAKK